MDNVILVFILVITVLEIVDGVVTDRDKGIRMNKIKNLSTAKLSYLEDLIYFDTAENCGKGE